MGEIKSTLDLVMEKTRGLVPSREEREAMTRKEHRDRVAGLARRIREGDLRPERLGTELRELEANPGFPWRDELCRACAAELTLLGEGHEALLAALEALEWPGADALREALAEGRARLEEVRVAVAARVAEGLRAAGIAGSAVVPNVDPDVVWQGEREALIGEFQRRRDATLGPAGDGP